MRYKAHRTEGAEIKLDLALQLMKLQSPEVQESLEKLHKRYGKYAASADEVRAMMDEALGDRTLTQELYELRED